jgi:hypothetical protein
MFISIMMCKPKWLGGGTRVAAYSHPWAIVWRLFVMGYLMWTDGDPSPPRAKISVIVQVAEETRFPSSILMKRLFAGLTNLGEAMVLAAISLFTIPYHACHDFPTLFNTGALFHQLLAFFNRY